jgi:hypothetical protein
MDLLHLETFGLHYAETLRRWRRRFLATRKQRGELGFDEVFERKWNFYFCYCEAGFQSRNIQVAQMVYGAPGQPHFRYEMPSEKSVSAAHPEQRPTLAHEQESAT